ncbi:uncharacterized protein LOC124160278 [Ischnura elegans]|uniref:uncharacterized protein LOC124160278 n=1 Tax=Ischnura elegans TaxID=197161 RepID=UPI001ED8BA2D|nr:uncharacterized protein LOC124160278 [Ischnura elegans]
MVHIDHPFCLLLACLAFMQLVQGTPLERYERAVGSDGVTTAEKGAIHRQRLALYNLLESPHGYNPDLERQSISRYIPLGLRTTQQVVAAPYKDIPSTQVYTSSGGLPLPTSYVRAPYATTQFIQPVDYQELYPYPPPAMYAPAYPYVYKSVVPE